MPHLLATTRSNRRARAEPVSQVYSRRKAPAPAYPKALAVEPANTPWLDHARQKQRRGPGEVLDGLVPIDVPGQHVERHPEHLGPSRLSVAASNRLDRIIRRLPRAPL